jgi:cyclase
MAASYREGVVDLGSGAYAYLQPDGGWGWSNAGLVSDGGQALLVDTLFDEALTARMLAAFTDASAIASDAIGTLVNTHANGDHTHGNALLPQAEIYASESSAREIAEFGPAALAGLKQAGASGKLGVGGEYFARVFAPFDFAGSRGKAPTRTFRKRLELAVGDKPVVLIEVGPAHTGGDVIVHSPKDKAVFTGDILFIESTPIMWAGPVSNWIAACELILALDVDTIVPGHGPLTDKAGVRKVKDYLLFIDREARRCYDAGLSSEAAAQEIALGEFDAWGDAERIAVNVETLYRGYRGTRQPSDPVEMFARMARLEAVRRRARG